MTRAPLAVQSCAAKTVGRRGRCGLGRGSVARGPLESLRSRRLGTGRDRPPELPEGIRPDLLPGLYLLLVLLQAGGTVRRRSGVHGSTGLAQGRDLNDDAAELAATRA